MKRLISRITAVVLAVCVMAVPAYALTVEQAIPLLEDRYVDKLPDAAYQAETMDELIQAIGDPYTAYMTAEEYEAFTASFNDTETVGIGVSVQDNDPGVLISSVLEDTPAEEVGLVAGDIILAVEGIPVSDINHAASLLTGQEGTTVTFTVLRQDGTQQEFTLTRRRFTVNTTATFSLSEDGTIGVIHCTGFGEQTSNHIYDAVRDYDDTVSTWMVDVRNNPGGSLSTSSGSVGVFVGSGVMAYLRDGQDKYTYSMVFPGQKAMTAKNTIILTNAFSASGSELFTSAMRDHGAAIAVGQRTHGKGVAQSILTQDEYPELFAGDALKLTSHRFFSPKGTTHDQGGVLPTLLVDPEYTTAVAWLLSSPEPLTAANCLNITLAGFEFYIQLDTALSELYRPAFVELLEALPPTAQLWMDRGDAKFGIVTLEQVLERTGLAAEFKSRTFRDLANTEKATAIDTLAVYDLVSGYGDGTFRPDDNVSRAEFCAMVVNALGLRPPTDRTQVFYDVPETAWYFDCVTTMYQLGYVRGYDDGGFYPALPITNEEAISILAKAAAWLNMSAYNRQKNGPAQDDLTGYSAFSDWAQSSAWLLEKSGVDLTDAAPKLHTSRAGAADLLCQLLTVTNVIWPTVSE